MQFFRGGTSAELIPFHLEKGEDLIPTLARIAEELHIGTAAIVLGSGALSVARLLPRAALAPASAPRHRISRGPDGAAHPPQPLHSPPHRHHRRYPPRRHRLPSPPVRAG